MRTNDRKATFAVKITNMIKLLLPILFPSWRFFSGVGMSPRFDLGFTVDEATLPAEWIPFRPLPERLSLWSALKHLVHNPRWNELLFMNSCAERLFEGGDVFYREEIAQHLLMAIESGDITVKHPAHFMCFRIRAIYSDDAPAHCIGQIKDEVVLYSGFYALPNKDQR